MVENALKKRHWNLIQDSLKLLPGTTVFNEKMVIENAPDGKKSIIMVYMIGGVTFGEIAAFRFLGKKYNKEILIATTHILNGNSLISSLIEKTDSEKE